MAGVPRCCQVLACLAILTLAACGEVDDEQARLCQGLIEALDEGGPFRVVGTAADPTSEHRVILRYVPEHGGAVHWVACQFAGSGLAAGRLDLIEVATDRDGELSDVQLHLLKRFWIQELGAGLKDGKGARQDRSGLVWAYAAQQSINAIGLSAVYILLALAFTLVYGVVGRINLAFGDLAMVGAYTGLIGIIAFGVVAGLPLPLVLILALLLVILSGGLWGWTTDRLVFSAMRSTSTQAALIASVGLAIALQEFVRLVQGANDLWLQPVFTGVHLLGEAGGFTVVVSTTQLVVLAVVAGVLAIQFILVDRGHYGRAWRAASQDLGMAALCGVNVNLVLAATMALATAYAGLAGLIVAVHYGVVSFHMGMILGFKALTGAIIGGLGSPRGAVLGGLVVGLTETFWTAYLDIQSKDIAVFALLALVLIFRPQGLVRPAIHGPDPGLR